MHNEVSVEMCAITHMGARANSAFVFGDASWNHQMEDYEGCGRGGARGCAAAFRWVSNSPLWLLSESVVLGMGKGGRQKATGGSAVWTSLISSGLLEKGRMGRCTKPRTRTQVKVPRGFRLAPLLQGLLTMGVHRTLRVGDGAREW